VTPASSLADRLFLPERDQRSQLTDLARVPLPPPLRPTAHLHVLDVTEFFGDTTGGVRTYLRAKASYVERRAELAQTVVVPGRCDARTESAGVRVYRTGGPRVPGQPQYRLLLAPERVRRVVEAERPDIIETGSPYTVPWIIRHATRRHEAPILAFWHSDFPRLAAPWPETAPWWRRRVFDAAWRYARAVDAGAAWNVCCSRYVADDLRAHGMDRVTTIPLGVDLELFNPSRRAARSAVRERLGLRSGPAVGFVGRFGPEKEIDLAVRAWPTVYARTGATLVLIGDGPARVHLEREACRVSGAASRPAWLDVIPFQRTRAEVADVVASLDAVVVPGSNESFGLAGLEAMACGVPVIAADRGGIAEVVADSGGGVLFRARDKGALAAAACGLLDGDAAGAGMRGRAYAEQHHSWEHTFDRLFALYGSIVRERGGRR